MDSLKTDDGVRILHTGGGTKQGGFWAAGLGGLVGGYLLGNVLRGSGMSSFGHRGFEHGHAGHCGGGVSYFDLEQSERISKLEGEVIRRDATIGSLGAIEKSGDYTDQRLRHELAEMRHWAEQKFVSQPTVAVTVTGATIGAATTPAA